MQKQAAVMLITNFNQHIYLFVGRAGWEPNNPQKLRLNCIKETCFLLFYTSLNGRLQDKNTHIVRLSNRFMQSM